MRTTLLATTILALSAGIATADVRVGGDGRMGVIFTDGAPEEWNFTSRIRITFTASGETDGGLTFGGSVRADNASTVDGGGDVGHAGNVFIAGAFGRLSMGDVAGAMESVIGDAHGVGLTGLGDFNEHYYRSNLAGWRPAARYDYSMGDFRFSLSADNPGTPIDTQSIGLAYSFGAFTAAVGYETDSGGNHYGARLEATLGDLAGSAGDVQLRAIFTRFDPTVGASLDQYSVSASARFGDMNATAFYRENFSGEEYYGLGGAYDLGGGAAVVGGIIGGIGGTRADFGMRFSF